MIDQATYEIERAICDKAEAYAESVMRDGGTKRRRNYLTAAEAAHPDYAACSNEMRGRVEQFELNRDKPEKLLAYVSGDGLRVTTWAGDALGDVQTITKTARINKWGERLCTIRAKIWGHRYYGIGYGHGMCVTLRKIRS